MSLGCGVRCPLGHNTFDGNLYFRFVSKIHGLWCARQESNLHFILRRDVSYPLYDERVTGEGERNFTCLGVLLENCSGVSL